ncbi:GTP-binding protein [Candidatus Vidania fulgoroideorum]
MKLNPIISIAGCNYCNCAIGIIKISLGNSELIFKKIIKTIFKKKYIFPRLATFSKIYINNKEIDNGIVLYFPSPNSYTGETVIEIQTHGNKYIQNAIIKFCIAKFRKYKLRIAHKGEFTKRAFLNKKLNIYDLKKMYNIINYNTNNLTSDRYIKQILKKLFRTILYLENISNFSNATNKKIKTVLFNFLNFLKKKKKQFIFLNINKANIAIVGNVNSGKSTLFNLILNKNRSITSEKKGTTTDFISHSVVINGKTVILHDTAGLRKTNNPTEQLGIKKTIEIIKKSNIIIYIVNKKQNLKLKNISKKPIIYIKNKIDKTKKKKIFNNKKLLYISCLKKIGISKLKAEIFNNLNKCQIDIINTKKFLKIIKLLKLKTRLCLNSNILLDSYIYFLKKKQKQLCDIFNFKKKSIINKLFKSFCIGK